MSAIVTCLLLVVTLIVTAHFYVKHAFSYWRRRGVPYVEPSFPFGNFRDTFLQKKSMTQNLEDIYNSTDEPFIGIYSTIFPVLLVRDPKLIKEIFIKDFQHFDTRGWQANVHIDPMADNILLQRGERWKNIRTQVSPAFSSNKLKMMFDAIVDCGKSMDKFVAQYADTDRTVEIRDVFSRFAVNIIVAVAFGIDIDCIMDRDEEFRTMGSRFFDPTMKNMLRNNISLLMPNLSKLLGLRFVDKEVGDFMIDAVRQNTEYRENNNVSRKDFFQMLMQLRSTGKIDEDDDNWTTVKAPSSKQAISYEEMAAHAYLFFAAGYESSGSAMSFFMYELAKAPHIQQKAYDDMEKAIANHGGKLTYDAVNDMKFVNQCMEESIRMHAPTPGAARRCTKAYRIPDTDIVIEEGTSLIFSGSGLHLDANYYPEPKIFKPERYVDEQKAGKNLVDMPNLSFGDGPRNCLGMRFGKLQTKLAVLLLLRKFRFELGDVHKNTELVMNPLVTVQTPINGINLKVFTR